MVVDIMYYSGETLGFYDPHIHEEIPKDAVKISSRYYKELIAGQSLGQGNTILTGEDGMPYLADRVLVPLDGEKAAEVEHLWIVSELNRAREELEKIQDSDPKAVGTVGSWRDYRKSLRVWSDNINFPNKQYRPSSPDS